ncbi:MAG: redoxin domain-containing protein [Flavobacteriaceae bacterium]
MIKSQKLNALICLIIILISCKSNTTKKNLYEVECNADGIYNGVRAYLKSSNNNKQVIDTAVVMNGAFKFKGEVSSPEMRILTIDGINGQTALVLESGKTNVTIYKDSIYKSIIKGGENNSIFNKYKDGYQNLVEKVTSLREEYMASRNNIEEVKRIQKQNVELRLELKNYGLNFLTQHPDTDFSLMLLESITLQKEFDAKLANEILEKIPNKISNRQYNIEVMQKINFNINNALSKAVIEVNSIAPDFTAPDPEGNQITLSEILGKVTILDFWASWCRPCRVENPNFVKLYDKYHEKGLNIISVSLDRENQKSRWIKAIEKDNLSWYNVSNLKYWQDPVALMYNITSIPATFILDDKGTIIATRLRGSALEKKIDELFER